MAVLHVEESMLAGRCIEEKREVDGRGCQKAAAMIYREWLHTTLVLRSTGGGGEQHRENRALKA
jgi:hypothetical protein